MESTKKMSEAKINMLLENLYRGLIIILLGIVGFFLRDNYLSMLQTQRDILIEMKDLTKQLTDHETRISLLEK